MILSVFISAIVVAITLFARYFLLSGSAYWYIWVRKRRWALKNRLQQKVFKREDIFREISYSFQSSIVAGVLLCLTYNNTLRSYTKVYLDPSDYGWAYLFSSFGFLIVFHDTIFYWSHRLLHTSFLFKKSHFIHHLSRNPTPFTTFAFHPLEALVQFGWIIPIFFFIPLNLYMVNVFSLISFLFNIIGHMGIEIYPPFWKNHWCLRYLNSASMHNRHHLNYKSNYGLYFNLWDRFMNTFQSQNELHTMIVSQERVASKLEHPLYKEPKIPLETTTQVAE